MNNAKHTPGPWTHSHTATPEHCKQSKVYSERDTIGRDVALVYDCQEHEANAALIAAAPELLEALRNLSDAVEALRWGKRDGATMGRISTANDCARAAIANAEGRA